MNASTISIHFFFIFHTFIFILNPVRAVKPKFICFNFPASVSTFSGLRFSGARSCVLQPANPFAFSGGSAAQFNEGAFIPFQ